MAEVRLAYGTDGLVVDLPTQQTTVVTPRAGRRAADPAAALRHALRSPVAGPPLRDVVRPGQHVAVSVCDSTRAQPRQPMLTALLEELDGIVRPEDVTVLVATGTHRANTPDELRDMFGPELASSLHIVNHDCRDDDSLVWRGRLGADVPVWLNRLWVEADVRITTGFVEPHFFAGFSGGPKMVAPGLAGLETVLTLHDAARIGSPSATWGVCEGNPVHDDVRAIAAATGVDFALDVILDADQQIVAAFGGEVLAMHEAARTVVRETAMVAVPHDFDVVVTTNSGYPLDQNLYQAVKGMTAAATVVKPGGRIIVASECRDGFPDHGPFKDLLTSVSSAAELSSLFAHGGRTVPDQWQVQVLARVLEKADISVHSSYLGAEDLASVHLGSTPDIGADVRTTLQRIGPAGRVCVLPEGPQTIPYISNGH